MPRRLAGVVQHDGATRRWRLAIQAGSIRVRPTKQALRKWIHDRSRVDIDDVEWVRDLRLVIEATADFHLGRAESALARLDRLGGRFSRGNPSFEAWVTLVTESARLDYLDQRELSQAWRRWTKPATRLEQSVRARLAAMLARARRFVEPERTFRPLAKIASALDRRGDVASLAVVLNVLGFLARRAGDPELGADFHRRAIGLSGIVGDYRTLQSGLFDVALCRRKLRTQAGQSPDSAMFDLVDLCLFVCDRFGVGADSAQAEISAAHWSIELKEFDKARRYLQRAHTIIKNVDSLWEQAYLLYIRSELELASRTGTYDPIKDLVTAERLFRNAGDPGTAREAARLRRRVKNSRS